VAGVPRAIFNSAAGTAASTATPFGESEIRPDHLFQLELVARLISTAFLAGTAGECVTVRRDWDLCQSVASQRTTESRVTDINP